MIVAIDRRKLQSLSWDELRSQARQWEAEWRAKGCPGEDRQTVLMIATRVALEAEHARRGVQLTLF
jgi:hypothetical protein